MQCPFCSHKETQVIDSRESEDSTRRRRECLSCNKRFTTYEITETPQLFVIKKDNRREPFNREKIRQGILKACEKRPIPQEQIDQIVNEIESKIRNEDSKEIPSKKIGELIIKKLKSIDKVAYIRFASVYKDFTDLETFEEEVKKLLKK